MRNGLQGGPDEDFPGPEEENDIEINVLGGAKRGGKRDRMQHVCYHNCHRTYSPIHFEGPNVKLAIENEDILDGSVESEYECEEVKVVNNIVYLED